MTNQNHTTNTPLKQCTKCGEIKPLAEFSKDKKGVNGTRAHCKVCQSRMGAEYRAENKEVISERKRRYRLEHPEVQREYRARNPDKIREQRKRYCAQYAEQLREKRRKHYADNAETYRERARQYHRDNTDAENERKQRYRANNPEKVREKNRKYREESRWFEKNKEYMRQWVYDNPEKVRVYHSRYVAKRRSLPDTLTDAEWQGTLAHFNGCCAVCGRPVGLWHTLAADHWVPLSSPECPGTVAWNMVPLCHGDGGCNNSKHARNATEWAVWKFGKRKGMAIVRRIETYLKSLAVQS